MELSSQYINQEVRRIVFSIKKPTDEFVHIFSILEKVEKDMQDYHDFVPNYGKEYNDFIKNADGKEGKVYLTVDRMVVTEDLYKKPWKGYYSGKELLKSATDKYKWPVGENEWRVMPSDSNNKSELAEILPKRYCPSYVRYCVPEEAPDEISQMLSNAKLKEQLAELSLRNLGYDLTEHSLYLGGFIFLTYNEIYRKIDFSEKDTKDGIYCRVSYKNGKRQPLTLQCKKHASDGGVTNTVKFELDGQKTLYELIIGGGYHSLEVDIMDKDGHLVDYYNRLTFIRSIHFDTRIGDQEVRLTNEDGKTIKKVQKYIEGDRMVIGEKQPASGLLDSSPAYSYRKFEEALDFVFYEGDKDAIEENIKKADRDILRIINGAHERVIICDVFFDVKSLARFVVPMDSRTVPVKILSGKAELKVDGKRSKLAKAIHEINSKSVANLECRLLTGKKAALHDRLIIADEQVWMLGCSLNEFGNRATTLIRVPKDYRKKLVDRVEDWWNDNSLTEDINDNNKEDNKTKRRCYICKCLDWLCGR